MRRRIRLPADVEMEDRLAWGLTARQLVILIAFAFLGYAIFTAASSALPLPVAAALTVPVALVGSLLAFGQKDGLTGDRLALAAARHLRQSPRRVAATDGLPAALPGAPAQLSVSLLRVPVKEISASGIVHLTDGSSALLLTAAGTSWALRSGEEQAALTDAYGRWLNSLIEPTTIAVRAEQVDLDERAETIQEAAVDLPHPALQHSAITYSGFLRALAREGDGLRRRQILLVLSTTTSDPDGARVELERRAAETESLLHAAGVELRTLDGQETATVLLDALERPAPSNGSELTGVIHSR